MKVTDIEVHEIGLEFHDWIEAPLRHYGGNDRSVVYVVHTDDGRVGLGESGSREPDDVIDRYLGSNPFAWIGDEVSLGLGTAMYDLMGQAAGVPVWQLFGPQQRAWVAFASWTVSSSPDHMAEAVRRYAARGFTWMKYHLSPFENVFDQVEAMQAVAPPGFRLHYDFTTCRTDDPMVDLLCRLQEYPISGCFEDVIDAADTEGTRQLRQRVRLPILRHQAPLGQSYEVLAGAGDGYILGHAKIGTALQRAGLFAAGGIPFSLQNVGGRITRAMTTHMMAAFPSATLHANCDVEIHPSDVVVERDDDPVNGWIRVPEGPGLGLTLDREELERLARLEPQPAGRWIVRTRYANGSVMYNPYDTAEAGHFMVLPDRRRGLPPLSFAAPVSTDYWDDDGSPEFAAMLARLDREGTVIEPPARTPT